jgi:hypothetical protein
MIKKLKLFAVGMLGAAAVVSANAKAPAAANTNILSTVNVALTLYSQGPTTTARTGAVRDTIAVGSLTTKGLITALTGSFKAGDLLVHVITLTNYDLTNYSTNFSTNTVYVTNGTTVTTNFVPTNTISTNLTLVTTNVSGAAFYEVLSANGKTATVISNGVLTESTLQIDSLTNSARVTGELIKANGEISTGNSIALRSLYVAISNSWNLEAIGLDRSTAVPLEVQTGSGTAQYNVADSTWTVTGDGFNGVTTNNTPYLLTGTIGERFYKKQ